jgi:sugar lactone lactonase YvrE
MNARSVRVIGSGYSFLEGPRWRSGRLFVSDFYTRRVLAFDARGNVEVICTVPGQPSGLGFEPDGHLLVVSMLDRRLLRLRNGSLEEVADLSGIAGFHCNDMLVDRGGRAYVGNFGWDSAIDPTIKPTVLAVVRPDRSTAVAADNLIFPNGIVQTIDGKTLLVAETFAARITAFDIAADGRLVNRRIWATFSDRRFKTIEEAVAARVPLPDGIALDADGALWIGDAAGRGPLRVAEGGAILERVDTGEQSVYAVALGDEDGRTLYMCAAQPLLTDDPSVDHRARLLSCRVSVPGALPG